MWMGKMADRLEFFRCHQRAFRSAVGEKLDFRRKQVSHQCSSQAATTSPDRDPAFHIHILL